MNDKATNERPFAPGAMDWVKLVHSVSSPPVNRLYHYTSANGLRSILGEGRVWASLIHTLNDSEEFHHALKQFQGAHLTYLNDPQLPEIKRILLRRLAILYEQLSKVNIFVFSLSAHRDDLSQWRSYCPKEGGYAIGFDPRDLMVKTSSFGWRLCECIYAENDKRRVAEDFVRNAMALVDDRPEAVSLSEDEFSTYMAPGLSTYICMLAPLMKDYAFHGEKEWRLISTPTDFNHPNVDTHVSGTTLVPHFSLDIGASIKEILVGPSFNKEASVHSLNFAKRHESVKSTQVYASNIPYRNL